MKLERIVNQVVIVLVTTLICTACEGTKNSDSSSSGYPMEAFVREIKGALHQTSGEERKAINDFSRVIQLKPKDPFAYDMRGACYLNLERYEKAINDFNVAIALDPKDYFAYNDRGWCYVMIGKYRIAVDDARKSIEIDPRAYNSWDTLGFAQYHMGLVDDALKSYNKALELRTKDGYVYYHRAVLYEKLRKQDLAQKDYAKAKELGYTPKKSEIIKPN